MFSDHPRVKLVGIVIDLLDEAEAIQKITERRQLRADDPASAAPLAVVSANLDHIAQFGRGGRWQDTLGDSLSPSVPAPGPSSSSPSSSGTVEWLTLLDGAPLAAQAARLTDREWPRLAGSDIVGPLLDTAEEMALSVGFLGGSYLIQRLLSRTLTRIRPSLRVAGMWSPDRSLLADHEASLDLARTIHESGAQVLIVGLGKPRQELWMSRYGADTGADVLLAFGAVVDFLAGAIRRAPNWVSRRGVEWAWRLALEPRRLARRYLLDDPPSLLHLRRDSAVVDPSDIGGPPAPAHQTGPLSLGQGDGTFVGPEETADVTVYIVTYNNKDSLDPLMSSLRREARSMRLRVVVADNDSSDETLRSLTSYPDAYALSTGGNLGYASGINVARRVSGPTHTVLVLNPDLEVLPGSISAMYHRINHSAAGVVVPQLLETDGSTYESLRREPTVATAFGDALFGAKFPSRPSWLAETDYASESYQHAHRVDWASGAAVMVRADVADMLGDWDEQFFLYSEEVDYFRRAREAGATIWYEPDARVIHHGGGSGASTQLNALLAVNRIRYIRKYHDARYAWWFRNAVALTEMLRYYKPTRPQILRIIMDESSWDALPGPTASERNDHMLGSFPTGSIIIPAHNEESVIGRTLAKLTPVLETGRVEVIVACNGCSDGTARIAKAFDGVRVLETRAASKVAAINAADASASTWPRLYLDADIDISPTAIRMVFERLGNGDVLAARPAYRYDVSSATWLVRSFYRARKRMPSTQRALWGAGAYALSESAHDRLGSFPMVTADDLYVDRIFGVTEKAIVHSPPTRVITPRTVSSLLAILRRNYRGKAELGFLSAEQRQTIQIDAPSARESFRELLAGVNGPASALDALIYAWLVARARLLARNGSRSSAHSPWERDDSSREPLSP